MVRLEDCGRQLVVRAVEWYREFEVLGYGYPATQCKQTFPLPLS